MSPAIPIPTELLRSVDLFRCGNHVISGNNCEIPESLHRISNADVNEVIGSQRLFYMCWDFGRQNHITKAVIKMRHLLPHTRSVSSHDLGAELLKCVLSISVCTEKLGDETHYFSKLAFQMPDLTLEVSLRPWNSSLFLNATQYRTANINDNCSKDCTIDAHKDTGRNNKSPGSIIYVSI